MQEYGIGAIIHPVRIHDEYPWIGVNRVTHVRQDAGFLTIVL